MTSRAKRYPVAGHERVGTWLGAGGLVPKPAAAAVAVLLGRDADSFHRGNGRASIYHLKDGSQLLRLEDFTVTNGPDLRVLLAGHPDPSTRGELDAQGYVELGRLKGNVGNQNYDVPASVDLVAQMSVVICCKPFHVVFSVAGLNESD